jgi:hypothetical protein
MLQEKGCRVPLKVISVVVAYQRQLHRVEGRRTLTHLRVGGRVERLIL